MSRHLYDLEKLMDTPFAHEALADKELYQMIVEHRRKFYHAGYADYDKDLSTVHPFHSIRQHHQRMAGGLSRVGQELRLWQSPEFRRVDRTARNTPAKIPKHKSISTCRRGSASNDALPRSL